jgi:hypothetical protein
MKELSKKILSTVSPKLFNFIRITLFSIKLTSNPNSYLNTTGFIKSYLLGKPVSKDDEPIPWMNYSVVEFLRERLTKNMLLFEYGSGYSTLFFSKLVKKVVSVEYDKDWYERMSKEGLNENVRLLYQELDYDGKYCSSINNTDDKYQVVIIDGRDRVRCALNSIKNLDKDGVLVFDDTNRERYNEGFDYLLKIGFKKLDFEGFKPTDFSAHKTSIFYKEGNCLGI